MENSNQPVYGIIYKITNLLNYKVYIGQTRDSKNLNRRPRLHILAALRGEDSGNKEFYRSIRKHGGENFKVEIIHYCSTQKQLDEAEKYFIQYLYNSWWKEDGYNVVGGGNHGKIGIKTSGFTNRHHTEEAKAKMSKTLKSANRKTIHSIETRRKISEKNKGRVLTEEHKKKIREGLKNRSEEEKLLAKQRQSLSSKNIHSSINWFITNFTKKTVRSSNTTGYTGVNFKKDKGKYQAILTIKGKQQFLGYFDTAIEASEAYNKKVNEILSNLEFYYKDNINRKKKN